MHAELHHPKVSSLLRYDRAHKKGLLLARYKKEHIVLPAVLGGVIKVILIISLDR